MTVIDSPRERVGREELAARLIRSSQKASYDPLVEVDWEASLDPDSPSVPWHRCSLYGTSMWEAMSERQRADLTRHEASSISSVGIWFELILISMLTRHVYEQDPQTQHVQYALTEIADECRHSVMFGKMSDKLGCPAYGPGRKGKALGKFFRATATPVGDLRGRTFRRGDARRAAARGCEGRGRAAARARRDAYPRRRGSAAHALRRRGARPAVGAGPRAAPVRQLDPDRHRLRDRGAAARAPAGLRSGGARHRRREAGRRRTTRNGVPPRLGRPAR